MQNRPLFIGILHGIGMELASSESALSVGGRSQTTFTRGVDGPKMSTFCQSYNVENVNGGGQVVKNKAKIWSTQFVNNPLSILIFAKKKLSIFVSLAWTLDNPYYHVIDQVEFQFRFFARNMMRLHLNVGIVIHLKGSISSVTY